MVAPPFLLRGSLSFCVSPSQPRAASQLQLVSVTPFRRTLEFGIYGDGDNNLDRVQSAVIDQAVEVSRADSRIEFTVEDTTARHGGRLHTDDFIVAAGTTSRITQSRAHDMSDEQNLTRFVARTLDNAI